MSTPQPLEEPPEPGTVLLDYAECTDLAVAAQHHVGVLVADEVTRAAVTLNLSPAIPVNTVGIDELMI